MESAGSDPVRPERPEGGTGPGGDPRGGTGNRAGGGRAGGDRAGEARTGGPVARPPRRLPRRLTQLYAGLVLYGASAALMVRAGLGLDPWDVFHQGVAEHTGLSIGTVSIAVGALVLLLWWPLRQRPGLGTVSNVVLVGLAMDGTLWLTPEVRTLLVRIPLLAGAIVLNGMATGLYISARFGPGPRDGLMTGLHQVTGRSLRLVRTGIELTVLACGFLLGGAVGTGTVAYALAIGPLSQVFLRVFALPSPGGTAGPASLVVARGAGPGRAILRR